MKFQSLLVVVYYYYFANASFFAVFSEYITGDVKMSNHEEILSEIEWLSDKDLRHGKSFNHYTAQPCKNLVLYLRQEEIYFLFIY